MLAELTLAVAVLAQANPIIVRRAAAPATPVDWSGSFIAVWSLEETSTTRANRSSTTCGSTCDLAETGGPIINDTTTFQEGSAAAFFIDADNERLTCNTSSGCTPMNISGSFSFGCWWRNTNCCQQADSLNFWRTGNNGFFLSITSGGNFECTVGDGTDIVTHSGGSAASNVWDHIGCTHDATADTIQLHQDGAAISSPATQQDMVPASGEFSISRASPRDIDGQVDECFLASKVLTAQQWCRICSCGIDGTKCTCSDATSYSDAGRNTSECGSCSLPACTAAAP